LVLRFSLGQFRAHGPKPEEQAVLVPVLAGLLAERAPQVECQALEAPLRQGVVQTVQQLIHPGRDTPAGCGRLRMAIRSRALAIVSSPSSDDRSTAVGEPYLQSSIANCVWLASVPKLRRLTQRTTKRDSMTGRITGAVVAAMLLGSAGIASTQIDRTGRPAVPTTPLTSAPAITFTTTGTIGRSWHRLAEFIGTPLRRDGF
jgi:hypothetical protein